MATGIVREYIGARYVPKFFENENNTPEWAPNVQYEPLTIVTYNQNSYTSKKPVPASVGNPSDNPSYWASTGNYNAQVEAYRQEVVQFKNDILDAVGTVSPMSYGAVGDGVTDDSAAVARAAEDGIIMDAEHTFYIASTILVPYGAVNTDFYLAKDATINSLGGDGSLWYGNKFHKNPSTLADGTRGKWTLNIRGVSRLHVAHNQFYNVVSALYVAESSGNITNNTFKDLPQTAATMGGNGYGVLLEACNNITIAENYFLNVARHSIYITIATSEDDPSFNSVRNRNINIVDNVFEWNSNVSGNTTGFEVTIMMRPVVNCVIAHNTFIKMQSVFFSQQQLTGDANYYVGCENVLVDSNLIIDAQNPVRQYDGIFYMSNKSDDTGNPATEDITISNNAIVNASVPFAKMQSVKNLVVKGNSYQGTGAYGFNIADIREGSHPEDVTVIDNVFNGIALNFWRGTSGYAGGSWKIIGNVISGPGSLMEMGSGAVFTEFVFCNNVCNTGANYATCYTQGMTLQKVIVKGNTGTVKYSWNVTAENAAYYDYDNTFSPLSAGSYPNMRRGAVLALGDNTIGIVQYNGTVKVLS